MGKKTIGVQRYKIVGQGRGARAVVSLPDDGTLGTATQIKVVQPPNLFLISSYAAD